MSSDAGSLPYAHGGPPLRGVLRAAPEDFFVDEDLGFEPEGAGEHAFVRVEKRGANSEWIARQLARHAGVEPRAVSFAGMKDRHAVTRQTFSVHLPGKADPEWEALNGSELRILAVARHRRKLQRGALRGNAFRIVLRDVCGDVEAAERTAASIRACGVPNYFGEQRFGREGGNVERARAMFAGSRVQRHEHGILLSAARAHLFNGVLAARVRSGTWNGALDGDVWMLAGTQSIFGPEPLTDTLRERLARGDIAPTGPLWGRGELRTQGAAAALEAAVAAENDDLARGLAGGGLSQERRTLVLRPDDLAFTRLPDATVEVAFRLRKGSYATALLGEICEWQKNCELRCDD
jgi:tRNA pseudouridine13 synthase